MSDQETEMEWFDDEPKKSAGGNGSSSKPKSSSSATYSQANSVDSDGYRLVHRDVGDAKGASGEIVIETSVKGLLYRCEVFKSGALIDAREIDCKDLFSNAEKDYIFKQRYMATHNTFKMQYIAEEFFKEFDSKEGDLKGGEEEHCKVVTSFSDDTIRTIIYVDGEEFETKEIAIKESIKNKKSLVEKRCRDFHLENVEKYIEVEKFPVNTFLNPILKKLPLYKKNPMHSFYIFILLLIVLLVALKFLYCGYLNGKPTKELIKKGAKSQFNEMLCSTVEKRCLQAKSDGWTTKKTKFKDCEKAHKNIVISDDAFKRILEVSTEDKIKLTEKCKLAKENDWKSADGENLKDTCYSFCNEGVIDKSICASNVAMYEIVPKELTLSLDDSQPIYLTNKSSDTLIVKIVDIQMDDSSKTEDIVYVVGLERTRTLESGESDEFRIRLEHSATQYFDANVQYTGTIKLAVLYDGKEKHEIVRFKFTLDI